MALPDIPYSIKPKEFTADFCSAKATGEFSVESKHFTFNVENQFETLKLELTFPKLGGIRLNSMTKGFFDTEEIEDISYEETEYGFKIFTNSESVLFTSGENWKIDVLKNDKVKFTFSEDNLKFGYADNKLVGIRIKVNKSQGEAFYGLGERYNGIFQNDEVILWNSDGYYTGNADIPKIYSYINVPLIHSTEKYSLFLNSTYCIRADFSKNEEYILTAEGPICDFYLWTGLPQDNIQSYTSLTGKPFIPPKWAFDYWAGGGAVDWEMNGLSIIPEIVKGWITEYEEMGAVPSALYGEGRPSKNPDIYKYLNEHNVRMLMWNYSGTSVNTVRNLLPNVEEKDLPVIRYLDNPDVFYEDYIDFSSPNAKSLITEKYKEFWDWGLKGIMVDFGEYVHWNTIMSNGMEGSQSHNLHAYFYNKANNDAWRERHGDDFVLFARAGCAGSQAYAANFTGDQASSYEGLEEQVNGVISASASGFSIIGGDLGGFFTQPKFDLYCRWLQFSTFTPLMRAHGCPTGRNPWEWGDYGRNIYKAHYFLRKNLSDLIYRTAVRSGETGIPMVMPFAMAYPENEAVRNTEGQYIFCDSIMVAPVTKAKVEEWAVIFPKGSWYNIWTGEKIIGENTVQTVKVPYDRGPVYFKSGLVTEIIVGDSYELATPVKEETAHKALLITEPDNEISINGYNLKVTDAGFEIIAENDSHDILIIHGKVANKVKVDGKLLNLTDRTDGIGYRICDNKTTAIHTDSKWKNITVV